MSIRVFSAALALGLGLTLAASGAAAAPRNAVVVASATTEVAVIAPLTVPSGGGGIIDAETLAEYTEPLGLLSRQLDAVAGKPVALAVDPMILASIRLLGASAPESALAWLERFSLITNDIVPLPYGNADVTLATQAGQTTTLEPLSFDFALDEENFSEPEDNAGSPTSGATFDPVEAGEEDGTGYPTTSQLLGWDYAIDDFLRPRTDTVVASDLPAFVESGYSTVLLSSTNVSRKSGAGAVTTIDGVTALISDAPASAAMDEALSSTLDRDVADAENALSASVLTAGSAQTAGTASVLIAIDHSLEVSAARLDAALATLTASPSITIVALTELVEKPRSAASIEDMPQNEARVGDAVRLISAAQAERSFFAIADDPEALVAARRLALLDVLGTMPTENPADWLTAVNGFIVESREILNSVTVVEASNFLLVADNGFLPISVNNSLNQAVTVYITVDPRTGLFSVGDSLVELRIEPNSQAKGDIPVQSLSNGVVDVEISLTGSNGLPVGSTTISEINVQAGWETPVVLTFGGLIVLIFAAGLVRSIVRRRKPEDD